MKITLPQQAKDHFDQEAEKLLLLLKPESRKEEETTKPFSNSHKPARIIDDKDVVNFGTVAAIDVFGKELSKYFHTLSGYVGLDGPDYETFDKLTDQIAGRSSINEYLTPKYVKETAFKWFEERYKGTIPQSQKLTEYLITKAESDIKDIKIGIPLSYIMIQEPFSLGKVTLDFHTKESFDQLEKVIMAKNPNFSEEDLGKLRQELQGVVFSYITVCAEKERAIEIAAEETEKALLTLRFFSPTAFLPQIPSYFGRKGYANVPVGNYLVFEDQIPDVMEQFEENIDFNHKVDHQYLTVSRPAGLDLLAQLLIKEKPNDLEKLLVNSISLFTKGILSKDHQDKIVFSLASVETLLLKNSTEPIQHSLGLRLAFIAGKSKEERKEILSVIRDAYEIRSSYLHHGKRKDDLATLTKLQHTVWTALRNVLFIRSKFANQDELLHYIDDMVLS